VPKLPSEMPVRGIGASLPSADEFYNIRGDELMARGKAQEALDANFVRQGKAVPLRNSPLATQNEAQAAFDRGGAWRVHCAFAIANTQAHATVGQSRKSRFHGWAANQDASKKAIAPNFFEGATPTNVPLGNARLPEIPQGNPTPFSSTPHEIPGINAPVGQRSDFTHAQDFYLRRRATTADLKRAGDLTQAPLQRLRSLANSGTGLPQSKLTEG